MTHQNARQQAQHQYNIVLAQAFHVAKKSMREAQRLAQEAYDFEYEVTILEEQGLTRSDAQGVVEARCSTRM